MAFSCDDNNFGSAVQQIKTLRAFRNSAIISEEDYTYRRDQVIDVLSPTGSLRTSAFSNDVSSFRRYSKSVGCSPVQATVQLTPRSSKNISSFTSNSEQDSVTAQINKHPPPNWNVEDYPIENATKITYDFRKKEWVREDIKVQIDTKPFDRGGLRLVYHLRDTSEPDTAFVAKLSIDPRDNQTRSVYFHDVRMQTIAAYFAKKYNSYNPPKLVEFISAYVLELTQREGAPVCGVEKFIKGQYRKYNNNYGWNSDIQRNTPNSFSHFSYVVSEEELLICDIQGVGDIYTDPQIHSKDGKGYGKGNLGVEGIENFLCNHQCNRICQFLRLPKMTGLPYLKAGTLPFKTLMNKSGVTELSADYNQGRSPISFYTAPALLDDGLKDSVCKCSLL